MACFFQSPGCNGVTTAPNACAFCNELAKDADLQQMTAIFPLVQIVKELEPRVRAANRAPMPAVPILAGKHVNKASVAGPTFDLSALTRSAGDQNCALCSCAGCVNLAVGYVKLTTKKVAKLHGVEDGYKALGGREEQERKIILFVTAQLPGYTHVVHGSDSNRMDLQTALAVMRSYVDETVFVVSTVGGISKGGVALAKASWGHWLNAVKKNGSIMFVDFQTDHEQRLGRGFVSSEPILGNFGVEWDNPRMQVIAFVPPLPLPGPPAVDTNPLGASGGPGAIDAAAQLPVPVHAATTTQQVVPLAASPWRGPTARQLRGRGMGVGAEGLPDPRSKRHAQIFDRPS